MVHVTIHLSTGTLSFFRYRLSLCRRLRQWRTPSGSFLDLPSLSPVSSEHGIRRDGGGGGDGRKRGGGGGGGDASLDLEFGDCRHLRKSRRWVSNCLFLACRLPPAVFFHGTYGAVENCLGLVFGVWCLHRGGWWFGGSVFCSLPRDRAVAVYNTQGRYDTMK